MGVEGKDEVLLSAELVMGCGGDWPEEVEAWFEVVGDWLALSEVETFCCCCVVVIFDSGSLDMSLIVVLSISFAVVAEEVDWVVDCVFGAVVVGLKGVLLSTALLLVDIIKGVLACSVVKAEVDRGAEGVSIGVVVKAVILSLFILVETSSAGTLLEL